MHELTESEVEEVLVKNLPAIDQHGETVERVGQGEVRLRNSQATEIACVSSLVFMTTDMLRE